jgi:phenylacetate-CoA ligase
MSNLIQLCKKNLFFLLESFRREPIQAALQELMYNQKQGSDYIHDIQKQKLKELLSYCFNESSFYASLYAERGLTVDNINDTNGLSKFPSVTKAQISHNLGNILTANGPKTYPVKTSGSTGSPLKFYKDRIASAYSYATMYRGLSWYGLDICDKEAYLWGIPLDRKERWLAHFRDVVLNRFREKEFALSEDVFRDFYKMMKKYRPKLLSGYSSFLYEFSLFINNNQLNVEPIRPKIIKYTAEMMYDFQRETIEKVFNCPVIGEYGSAEIGVIAYQCAKGNYHVFNDCCILEFEEREDGLYEIIATNLIARGFPFVRYRTGDLVAKPVNSSCACGLPFPAIEPIIGRSADIVFTPERKRIHSNICSNIIKHLIKGGYSIDRFLFIQESVSQLKVLVSPFEAENLGFQIELTSLVHDKISPAMQVVIKPFSNYEHFEQRGKLRYFISKLKENDTP